VSVGILSVCHVTVTSSRDSRAPCFVFFALTTRLSSSFFSVNMIGSKVEHLNPKLHKQCDGNLHCFRVIPAYGSNDSRELILMASSQAEADAWVASLQGAAKASGGDFLDGLNANKTKSMGSTHSRKMIDLTPNEE